MTGSARYVKFGDGSCGAPEAAAAFGASRLGGCNCCSYSCYCEINETSSGAGHLVQLRRASGRGLEGMGRGRNHEIAMRFRRILNLNVLLCTMLVHLRYAGGFWQLVSLPGAGVGKHGPPYTLRIGGNLGGSSVSGRVLRPTATSRYVCTCVCCVQRLGVHDPQQQVTPQQCLCCCYCFIFPLVLWLFLVHPCVGQPGVSGVRAIKVTTITLLHIVCIAYCSAAYVCTVWGQHAFEGVSTLRALYCTNATKHATRSRAMAPNCKPPPDLSPDFFFWSC